MTETKLEIKTKTTDKATYNNINIKALEDGQFAVVEKLSAEGYKNVSDKYKDYKGNPAVSYSCKVKYADKECSFWLNERQHAQYAVCGGIGDKVKISCKEEVRINPKTKVKTIVPVLSFEKVA